MQSLKSFELDNREQFDLFTRVAAGLATVTSVRELASLEASSCRQALRADALCVYFLNEANRFEMLAQEGCTPKFVEDCRIVERDSLPLAVDEVGAPKIFLGTTDEFTRVARSYCRVAERSTRQLVGYAPLAHDGTIFGFIGFSYNDGDVELPDQTFLKNLIELCSRALFRAKENEGNLTARILAEKSDQNKTEYLSALSHEIRTPLGLVSGYIDVLATSKNIGVEERRWVQVIQRNTSQLASLIGMVLDTAKLDFDRFELEPAIIDTEELILDLFSVAQQKASEKSLVVKIERDGLPSKFVADSHRIRQVILNLVSNAIKFTSDGHIRLTFTNRLSGVMECAVEDTGMGMDRVGQAKLFKAFSQTEASIAQRFGGTGLGLYLSKRIAHKLGGDVTLRVSAPGRGSTFVFQWRYRFFEENLRSAAREAKGAARTDHSILVCDDSADNCDLIRLLLHSVGIDNVSTVENGHEALKLVGEHAYDLVFMDLRMPGMDGAETLTRLRQMGFVRPVVALTASAVVAERDRCLRSGFDGFLTKPYQLGDIVACIAKLTRDSERPH